MKKYFIYIDKSNPSHILGIHCKDYINNMERCVYDCNSKIVNKPWVVWTNDTITKERIKYYRTDIKQLTKLEAETIIFIHKL